MTFGIDEMTAAIVVGPNKISIERVPPPRLRCGLIIQVSCCGICGSDIRQFSSARAGERKVIGHEVVGKVVDAPKELGDWIGKKVGVAPRIGCNKCGPCRRGLLNLCEKVRTVGYQLPGGFSQFLALPPEAVDAGNLVHVPNDLDEKVAVLAEPLSCVLNGISLSSPPSGSSVLIYGAGPMGQMFVMMALNFTKEVYVVEPDLLRRKFALSHGAQKAFPPGSDDIPPAETTIIACSSPLAYQEAIVGAPRGGTINLFGGLPEGVKIDSNEVHYRQLTIHGTSGSTPSQYAKAMEVLRERPELGDIVTRVIPFSLLEDVLKGSTEPNQLSLKAVLDPWME